MGREQFHLEMMISRIYDKRLTMSHFFRVRHNGRKTGRVCVVMERSKWRFDSSPN